MSFLGTVILTPIEIMLDRLIAHDPHTVAQVERFDGKLLEIIAEQASSSPLALCIAFRGASIKLNLASSEALMQTPDAKIVGSRSDLLNLLTQAADDRALSNPDLTVSGDANFVQALYHLASNLDLRWDDYLAPFIGDVASHELARVGSELREWRRESVASLSASVDEYLTEEARILPSANEVTELRDRFDSLRLRMDRADARLSRLEAERDTA